MTASEDRVPEQVSPESEETEKTAETSETAETDKTEGAPESEESATHKTFRVGCMTFCLAVTLLFLWVWHHQTQFNDHYRKATFLMRKGEAEQAIAAYQRAIKNKKRTIFFTTEPSAYNNLGQAYLYTEAYDQAIANFTKVIELAPGIPEGYVNLTTAYLRQRLPADARVWCLRALETFPETAFLHYNLACAYALEDASAEALNSLKQAVALNRELKTLAQREDTLKAIVSELP